LGEWVTIGAPFPGASSGGANGDSITLTVNGNTTIPLVRGTNYNAAAITGALQGTN
jgi:hypothetical protein